MVLKKLELQGFKSFPQKTVFEYANGITAIVGPNGCGKSNVSDAIRWVLGEQRAKQLRGDTMEDFIFSGTQEKSPMNVAKVSLTLDNSNHLLDFDYHEVTITRKLYRSGESEYFINKTPCRLKDISEIFMDTGIGKDTYSIISQGELDKILSASPEDRRYLFEEASGIAKHKHRKKEALRKLEYTKTNLSRVTDIIEELSVQLPTLKEQSEKAQLYQKMTEEIKTLDTGIIAHKIEEGRGEWYELDKQEKSLTMKYEQHQTEAHTLESQLQEKKSKLADLDHQLEKAQQNNLDIVGQIEKTQGFDNILKERIEHGLREKARLLTEQMTALKKEQAFEKNLTQINTRLSELKDANNRKTEELRSIKETLSSYYQDSDTLEDKKANLIDVINGIQRQKMRVDTLEKDQHRLNRDISELSDSLETNHEHKETLNERFKRSQGQKEEKEKQLTEIMSQTKELEKEIPNLEAEEKQIYQDLNEAKNKLHSLKSKFQMMDEFYNKDTLSKGVKAIMTLKHQGDAKWQGIIGTVQQLIAVPSNYQTAIDVALGRSLQNIVTDSDETAKKVLAYLKQNKLGRTTCLPLNNLRSKSLSRHLLNILEEFPAVEGLASQLLDIDPSYQIVADYLLGRVVVVQSLNEGLKLAKRVQFSIKIVTLDGELILPGGAMVGGSVHKTSQHPSSTSSNDQQRKKIQHEMDRLQETISDLEKQLSETKRNLEENRETLRKLYAQKHDLDLELRDYHKDMERLEHEGVQLEETLETYALKLESKKQERDDGAETLKRVRAEIQELTERKAALEKDIDQLETNSQNFHQEYKQLNEEKLALEVELGKLEERIENVSEDKRELVDDLSDYREKRLPELRTELHELADKIDDTFSKRIDNQAKQEMLYQKQKDLSYKLDQLKDTRANIRDEVENIEEKLKTVNHQGRELDQQLNKVKMHKSRQETQLRNILDRLYEQYQLTFEDIADQKVDSTNLKQYERQMKEKKQELEKLGTVNLGAIDEYQRLNERMHFLRSQREDLLKAEESLKRVLREIDQTMKKNFKETVTQINKAFKKVFREIYQGGTAHLEYTDEQDLLNTGIEIVAKPPGKNKQILSLLSGGERALTVLALLFAVHEIKPTPFCVLDEIDASLDDNNLDILTKFLRNYASRTQFIVITHRQKTMLAADTFYGVTMPEPGVSQLITVKLDDKTIATA